MGGQLGAEADYKIKLTKDKELGEGSYAKVYKIRRKKDGMLCAGKIFK